VTFASPPRLAPPSARWSEPPLDHGVALWSARVSKDFLKTLSPMHSISGVQEIVDAVVFLTQAPHITGEVLRVDGGTSGQMVIPP
jgi:NAD(P)-dependent dehydrogenase (short-subunit alcohol dehydrogenase family)